MAVKIVWHHTPSVLFQCILGFKLYMYFYFEGKINWGTQQFTAPFVVGRNIFDSLVKYRMSLTKSIVNGSAPSVYFGLQCKFVHIQRRFHIWVSRSIPTRRDANNSHDKNETTTIIMNESFHTTNVKRQTTNVKGPRILRVCLCRFYSLY